MLFDQFYLQSLGHASYLVGDEKTGQALIFDPRRDVGNYFEAARERPARQRRSSARRFRTSCCPCPTKVFPTHVAGSLCGGNIGSRLSTSVGYERHTNAILTEVDSTDGFVRECIRLDNLPAVPPYWRRMRSQNLAGVTPLGTLAEPPALSLDEFDRHRESGAPVLDTRAPEAFGGSHVPGALNVGLGSAFATWAGTVLPGDTPVLLVLDRPSDLWEVTWQLLRIGYPAPLGWLRGGITSWRTSGRPIGTIPQITVHELNEQLDRGDVRLLDVRQPAEWATGHAPGATHITGAELPERLDEIDNAPVAVSCGSGYRSSVAASLLARAGHTSVVNVAGGMTAWNRAKLPMQQG